VPVQEAFRCKTGFCVPAENMKDNIVVEKYQKPR
jgi:hypothetical protein